MGGRKALAQLDGVPLIAHPLAAARAAQLDAVVVAKEDTALPPLAVPVWREPDEPVHPLLGIVTALERAQRPIVAVGCDMPFVTAALLRTLAQGPEAAVRVGDRLAPFPARYMPGHLPALRAALAREASVTAAVTALHPIVLEVADERLVASINTPEELRDA